MVEQQYVNEFKLELGSVVTGKFYEMQELRKSTMNRIRNIVFRKYTGLELRELQKKKKKTDEEKQAMKDFTDDQIPNKLSELLSKGKIGQEEYDYIQRMFDLLNDIQKKEKQYHKLVSDFVKDEPIYKEFTSLVKGVDVLSTAMFLFYFGYCEKAKYPSSLQKYCGITPDSKYETGKTCGFNPEARTFLWRVSDCLIKQNFKTDAVGNKLPDRYRVRYVQEKEKQLNLLDRSVKSLVNVMRDKINHFSAKEKTAINKVLEMFENEFSKKMSERYANKGDKWKWLIGKSKKVLEDFNEYVNPHAPLNRIHADYRARRKMMKGFLIDYYRVAKTLTGQEQSTPYAIEKLGHDNFDDVLEWIEQRKAEEYRKEHGVQ